MKRKALITGITGQDGSYLAEFLLAKDYEVHGIIRRESFEKKNCLFNLENCLNDIHLHSASIENHLSLYKVIQLVKPDEFYHLAGQSFVSHDFSDEFALMNTNFHSTLYILSAIIDLVPNCKLYYAGSSEMIGSPEESPQHEKSWFNPKSLYGIAKSASYYAVRSYRQRRKLFACVGILYNHESPRRGYQFVTRKITSVSAEIKLGISKELTLGNLSVTRDWGYAPDYVRGMWLMLQQKKADDFILSTGKSRSVKEFIDVVFEYLQLDVESHIKVDEIFFRDSEVLPLVGNSNKARNILGWRPIKPFKDMVIEMVENDLSLIHRRKRYWCDYEV